MKRDGQYALVPAFPDSSEPFSPPPSPPDVRGVALCDVQVLQGLALMHQPWAALAPATRDALAVAVYRQVQGMPPPP